MNYKYLIISVFFFPTMLNAQGAKLLEKLMKKESVFDSILALPEKGDVQIIYQQINRNKKNEADFKTFKYNVDSHKYFYPANSVDLPAAVLTLEKLNNYGHEDVHKDQCIRVDTNYFKQTQIVNDPISKNGKASLSNYIEKMFLYHDVNSYNRCYEFLGQQYFNERMHNLGFVNSWFLHRIGVNDDTKSARYTNPIEFFRDDKVTYFRDVVELKLWPTVMPYYPVMKQKGEYNDKDYYAGRKTIVIDEVDYTNKNNYPLVEMSEFLKDVFFNPKKFNLTSGDLCFLFRCMGQRNNETSIKNLPPVPFCRDFLTSMPDTTIRVFSNSGSGYGYIIENAYFIDLKNKVEFILTAVYKESKTSAELSKPSKEGIAFMQNLGKMIYNYELERKRKTLPDLSSLDVF